MLRSTSFLAILGITSLSSPAEPIDFTSQVQPLLNKRCAECHGGVKQKGDLTLTNREQALQGGTSGDPLLVPGKPAESELFRRLTHDDPDERMPPKHPLPDSEIAIIKRWISEGATWPEHWAYRRLKNPNVPPQASPWARTEIDRFVLRKLDAAAIPPSPPAKPTTLLRRLHLDLTGLPPTVEELEAFEKRWDEDPEACLETTVDLLLTSPHFGERWGRHWLDQARYADSDGYEKDNARPHAWVFRDWVIQAINEDMPLDQFTIEQMAGDLLEAPTPDQRVATAFHRQTLWNREGGTDQEEDRVKRTIDRVATTARSWLGLTVECAQCHDHPYDPITQREFYQFFAFFNNANEKAIQIPNKKGGRKQEVHVMIRNGQRKTYLLQRGDFLQPDIEGGEIKGGGIAFLHQMKRKDAEAPTRLDLANWIVSPENPLTARVLANTIWMHLFGQGLSRTPDNFGSQGSAPSHPELLDWLASTLVSEGWSRKKLIKTIVLSNTYRQAVRHRNDADIPEMDPENRLLHRQNRRRVEAEIVRDLHLTVSGQLDHRIGGKSVFPPIPLDVAAQSFANNYKWKVSEGPNRYRRGLYTFFKRTAPDPNLMTFDCPDSNISITQRNISNTPTMALATLQNAVFHEAAQAFAKRLLTQRGGRDERALLTHAYRIALSRAPTEKELTILGKLLEDYQQHYQDDPKAAEALAAKWIPEGESAISAAPWIATLRILTNLDEFITRN